MSDNSKTQYRSRCPINITLELLGDRWSLLIVRDALFKGIDTYNGFLGSAEKIATNILSDRLSKLEMAGILVKKRDPNDARRIRYQLTEKGKALMPVLIEVMLWAEAYEDTGLPADIVELIKTDRQQFIEWLQNKEAEIKND